MTKVCKLLLLLLIVNLFIQPINLKLLSYILKDLLWADFPCNFVSYGRSWGHTSIVLILSTVGAMILIWNIVTGRYSVFSSILILSACKFLHPPCCFEVWFTFPFVVVKYWNFFDILSVYHQFPWCKVKLVLKSKRYWRYIQGCISEALQKNCSLDP